MNESTLAQLEIARETIKKLEVDKENLKFETYRLKARITELEIKIEEMKANRIEEIHKIRDEFIEIARAAIYRD